MATVLEIGTVAMRGEMNMFAILELIYMTLLAPLDTKEGRVRFYSVDTNL
jgi:hypothetical protein